MKLLFGLIFSALALNIHAEQADLTPTKSGMYDVGGFKLYIECYENDKPSLILEQGFGRWGSDGVWKDNISKLTSDFSVCLYDRAGLGKSDKGPVPFDVTDMAERLNKLLNAADIKAPHYFAGGSYASYIITAYHKNYPNEVSGVMLIDPPPFGYFHTMATRWPDNLQRTMNNWLVISNLNKV
jgi:pimeloyl-ACP methyl ester carboxylesterase